MDQPRVSNIVSVDIQKLYLSHRVSGRNVLRSLLSKVIRPDFQLLEIRDVAEMTQLDSSSLGDLVHIDFQISHAVELFTFNQVFETLVTNSVDSEIKDFQVSQLVIDGDVVRTFRVYVV